MKAIVNLFCYLAVFAVPFVKYASVSSSYIDSIKEVAYPHYSYVSRLVGMAPVVQNSANFVMTDAPSTIILCSEPDDIMDVTNISLLPDPPRKGENLTVVIAGKTKSDIVGGAYMFASVKKGVMKFPRMRFEICDYVVGGCPIAAGSDNLSLQFEIPKMIPGGSYEVKAEIMNKDTSPSAIVGRVVSQMKRHAGILSEEVILSGNRIACAEGSVPF